MTDQTTKTVTVTRYTDVDVTMPDGTALPLRIRAFTRPELTDFMQGFSRIEHPPCARAIFRRAGEDDVSMPVVRARRLAEMTPDQAEAHRQAELDDAEYLLSFAASAVAAHVSVQPGVILNVEDASGATHQVHTGEELAAMYAGDVEALAVLARVIGEENTLSLEKKRRSRSSFASMRTSSTSDPAPPSGPTPGATAPSAAPPPGSVSPDDASEALALILSGETP